MKGENENDRGPWLAAWKVKVREWGRSLVPLKLTTEREAKEDEKK